MSADDPGPRLPPVDPDVAEHVPGDTLSRWPARAWLRPPPPGVLPHPPPPARPRRYPTVLPILNTGSSSPATMTSVIPAITRSMIGSISFTISSRFREVRFSRPSAI